MGLYDRIHTGYRCGQTEALGQTMSDVHLGDEISPEAFLKLQETTFQVAMHEGGYLQVIDAKVSEWVPKRSRLPLFSSAGKRITLLPENYCYSAPEFSQSDAYKVLMTTTHVSPSTESLAKTVWVDELNTALGLPGTCLSCSRIRLSQ